MITLKHFKYTNKKGHYDEICHTTYPKGTSALSVFNDGMSIYKKITDPNYAGFMVQSDTQGTLYRMMKKRGDENNV